MKYPTIPAPYMRHIDGPDKNKVAVANGLGIDVVPLFMTDNVPAAIHAVRLGVTSSWGNFPIEGLVGTAPKGLLSRGGERLQMKIKTEDFRHA